VAGPALIAVVDDAPRILRLLELELQDLGFAVRCYPNAASFLESLHNETPDLVLLDILMPRIDGIECLYQARESGYEGKVVIFTAISDNQKRQEAMLAGAQAYVLKPDLFRDLDSLMSQHLPG